MSTSAHETPAADVLPAERPAQGGAQADTAAAVTLAPDAAAPRPEFTTVFAAGPCQLALYDRLDRKALAWLARTCGENAKSAAQYLLEERAAGRGIRAVDVGGQFACACGCMPLCLPGCCAVAVAGHVALLHRCVAVPGTRLLLPPAVYDLRQQGTLPIAAGVEIVGQEGVEFAISTGIRADEGARIVSVHFSHGVHVVNGSMTMVSCTSTGTIQVGSGLCTRLVMEDCRIFGCCNSDSSCGVYCRDAMLHATRCTIEDNISEGVYVEHPVCSGRTQTVTLVQCAVRNNGRDGVRALTYDNMLHVVLVGGSISGNAGHGVVADGCKVTVAAMEHSETGDRQTVSSGNGGHDWSLTDRSRLADCDGVIEGLAEGIEVVREDASEDELW